MHSKIIFALLPALALAAPAAKATQAPPPLPVQCNPVQPNTPLPNYNDCNTAIGQINPNKDYECGATFTKGSCTVGYSQCAVNAPDIDGAAYQTAALEAIAAIKSACKSHSGVYIDKDGKHYSVDNSVN